METVPSSQNQKSHQLEMFENPGPEVVSYELLSGHKRTDGSLKSTPELHTEYVRLTDDLVHAIVDGVEVLNPETDEKERRPVDYVVWLDKSARPISWLMKELCPILAKDKDNHVPKIPESKFVNIDRNQWASEIDPQGSGRVEVEALDPEYYKKLALGFFGKPPRS